MPGVKRLTDAATNERHLLAGATEQRLEQDIRGATVRSALPAASGRSRLAEPSSQARSPSLPPPDQRHQRQRRKDARESAHRHLVSEPQDLAAEHADVWNSSPRQSTQGSPPN